MPYAKGESGNPAGRKSGQPNKASTAARKAISAALAGATADKLCAHLDSLSGKEYIDAYVKLAEFITPKLQRTALEGQVTTQLELSGSNIYLPDNGRD